MNLFQQTSDGYRTWTYLIITNTTSHPWRHIAKLNRGFVNDCVNIFSSIAMCKHQFHVDHKRKMTPSYYFHCFCVRKFPLQREQPWLRKYKRLGLALFGSTFFFKQQILMFNDYSRWKVWTSSTAKNSYFDIWFVFFFVLRRDNSSMCVN